MNHLELFSNKNSASDEVFDEDSFKYILSGTNVLLDVIKSTLGPKGTLKILQGQNDHLTTNDGATIMSNVKLEVPSARVLMETSKLQDYEEGDGTTSIAILASLILKHAYSSKTHPRFLVKGINKALEKISEILEVKKFKINPTDVKSLVKTTLCSKILNSNIDLFSDICIEAIQNLKESCNLDLINVVKVIGNMSESRLVKGILVEKNINFRNNEQDLNKKLSNLQFGDKKDEIVLHKILKPKVLVVNTALDFDKIKLSTSKANVNSILELKKIEDSEKQRMRDKINDICKIDFDVLINRQIIYDYNMQLLLDKGKYVIENADFGNVERLHQVLGGKVLSHFCDGVENNATGTCEFIEQIQIKEKNFVKFSGCKNKGASTILLFGSSNAILEEGERALHDALCVLKRIHKEQFLLLGGGSTEIMLGMELLKYSQEIKTVESEGVLVLSNALLEFVDILTTNCGFNSKVFRSSIISMYNNRSSFTRNNFTQGLDINTGKPNCMKSLKVFEGFSMKIRVLKAACEAAQSLLKCDGVITHAPRERHRH
ncbi:CCT2 [Ecytonucleospora hepatopenaei]|uniref:CCT2 n=1 Tax=Ecytonucleospora hepatopenaei TaxID=646526 RepID=A0A1W0E6L3_9MICR|nr:CCT2 [Ecytonucleospora hepatopenaei]